MEPVKEVGKAGNLESTTHEQAEVEERRTQRRIEALFDPLKFEELFNYAQQLYLSEPIGELPPLPEPSTEARVVSLYGTRALRSAYEFSTKAETLAPDEAVLHQRDMHLKHTELLSQGLNRDALQKAEKLGEAMMDEMFTILGRDAPKMVDKLRHAKNLNEMMAVISWLDTRLGMLGEPRDEDAAWNGDDGFYHPIRLSAKLVGEYPRQNMNTTCLGVSIAAAGFFKRAGLPQIHAGVMSTRQSQRVQDGLDLLYYIHDNGETLLDEPLANDFKQRIETGTTTLVNNFLRDRGYHASVYTKLKTDEWVQFDSNYFVTAPVLFDSTNKRLDQVYGFLNEMKEIAPGLEVAQPLEGYMSAGQFMVDIIKESTFLPHEAIQDFIMSIDPEDESIPQHFFEYVVEPYFTYTPKEEDDEDAIEAAARRYAALRLDTSRADGHTESYLSRQYHAAFDKFILANNTLSPAQYIAQCHKDPNFLARATSDIRQLPLMVAATIGATNHEHRDIYPYATHPYVEAGLPEIRIGLAVLSDLAVYSDIGPSADFWISNWASLTPITEASHLTPESFVQKAVIKNNLWALANRSLIYDSHYGIVRSFLSDATPRDGDEHGSKEAVRDE